MLLIESSVFELKLKSGIISKRWNDPLSENSFIHLKEHGVLLEWSVDKSTAKSQFNLEHRYIHVVFFLYLIIIFNLVYIGFVFNLDLDGVYNAERYLANLWLFCTVLFIPLSSLIINYISQRKQLLSFLKQIELYYLTHSSFSMKCSSYLEYHVHSQKINDDFVQAYNSDNV